MLKKISALAVMFIFIISLVPLALAENDSTSNSTEDIVEDNSTEEVEKTTAVKNEELKKVVAKKVTAVKAMNKERVAAYNEVEGKKKELVV